MQVAKDLAALFTRQDDVDGMQLDAASAVDRRTYDAMLLRAI